MQRFARIEGAAGPRYSGRMKPQASPPLPPAPARRSESLADKVYWSVHQKIASGALDPSGKITETQMATWLGVSRTPVREALARLRREGLLDPTRRMARLARLDRADIQEIMELRLLMEPYIAGRAAERATPGALAGLERALREEERTLERRSAQMFIMANHAFRQELLGLGGNGRLAEVAARYDAQVQALRRATLTRVENRRTVLEHHRSLLKAIRAGDRKAAEAAMRALIEAASAATLALVTDGGGGASAQ